VALPGGNAVIGAVSPTNASGQARSGGVVRTAPAKQAGARTGLTTGCSNRPIGNPWQPTATAWERVVRGGRRFESFRGLQHLPSRTALR